MSFDIIVITIWPLASELSVWLVGILGCSNKYIKHKNKYLLACKIKLHARKSGRFFFFLYFTLIIWHFLSNIHYTKSNLFPQIIWHYLTKQNKTGKQFLSQLLCWYFQKKSQVNLEINPLWWRALVKLKFQYLPDDNIMWPNEPMTEEKKKTPTNNVFQPCFI